MTGMGKIEGRIERKARLRWVPLTQMRVNPLAQRDLNQARVSKLAAVFDPEKMETPTVNHRGDWYYLIDGQHRIAALKQWLSSWQDQQVQCWTYEGLSEVEEAEKFLALNDTLPVRAFAKFKVSVQAGRDTEADVDRIVRALGLRIARGSGISAVATLRRVYTRGGAAVLSRALRIIRDAYGEAGLDGPVIDGIGLLCQRYNGDLSEQRAIERLSSAHGGVSGTDQPGRATTPVHRQRHRPVRGGRRGRGHQPRLGRPEASRLVEGRRMTYTCPGRSTVREAAASGTHLMNYVVYSTTMAAGAERSRVAAAPVAQGLLEVLLDGLEDHAVHQFLGFGQADPAHLGQLVLVADEHVGAVRRLGRHVDHGAPGRRMHAAPDHPARLDAKARLLLDLPHGGIGRALPGFDLARDEGPRRLAVLAPADQDAQVAGHDGRDHWARLGSGGRFGLQVRVQSSCRDDLVGEGLADPQPLGHLAERQVFSVVDANHLLMEDGRGVVGNGPELPGEPDGGVGAVLRAGHRANAGESRAARFQRGVNLALDVLHATSVQPLIVQGVDGIVHPLYGEATP